jgi:hypothetical protein
VKREYVLFLSATLGLVLILGACSMGQPGSPTSAPQASVPTTSLPAMTEPPLAGEPSTDPPVVAEAPTITATTTPITHTNFPGLPKYNDTQLIRECAMGYSLMPGKPVLILQACDAWSINFLERPMTSDQVSYLPYIDIEMAQIGVDSSWYYGRVRVYEGGVPGDGTPYYYYFEFDIDFDRRGDLLIAVQDLPLDSTEWSVSGVRAWRDMNGDVGGETPIRADTAASGDGYETLVFDQGAGADPDLVWARRSPNSQKWIEIAFKPALMENDATFTWMAGAFQGAFDPTQFDLVDATPGAYQVDNTCAMEYNSAPLGLPNGCRTIQPTPTALPSCTQPPKPTPDTCWIWFPDQCRWICFN